MSTMESVRRPRTGRVAVATAVGALVSLVTGILAVTDTGGLLSDRAHVVYDGYVPAAEVDGSASVYGGYLAGLAALGVVCWALTWWAQRRGARWAAVLGTVIFGLAALIAVVNLTISEYGRTVLPVAYNGLGIAAVVVGAVAVGFLWKDRPQR